MATAIALFNNKAGVGKTTLTLTPPGPHGFPPGWRVLAVDLDPQANLTSAFFDDDKLQRDRGAAHSRGAFRPGRSLPPSSTRSQPPTRAPPAGGMVGRELRRGWALDASSGKLNRIHTGPLHHRVP